jgi:hypothetical protein
VVPENTASQTLSLQVVFDSGPLAGPLRSEAKVKVK